MIRTGKHRLILFALLLALLSAALAGTACADWQQFDQPAAQGVKAAPYLLYSVYTPEDMKPGLPLVVYLHSSDGISWSAMGSQIDLPMLISDGTVPPPQCVLLVPQLTRDHNLTWSNVIVSVNSIVERVIDEFEVDTSRISLTGFSLGGIGLWELASLAPDRYARLLCIGGRANNGIEAETFVNCEEIRVFSSTGDLRANRNRSEEFVNALLDAGINASFELLSLQHTESPRLIYGDPDIQKWLWLIPEDGGEAAEPGETPEEPGETPEEPAETTEEPEEITGAG